MILISKRSSAQWFVLACSALLTASCMPPQTYRPPLQTSQTTAASSAKAPPAPAPTSPPASSSESSRRPVLQESKIREQDLKRAPAPPAVKDLPRENQTQSSETRGQPEITAPPLRDDSSLLAKITPGTPPQRAASLRLTDEGRKLLEAGDPQRALSRLEKTIVIDSTNPYGYYYLAKTHYKLGRYKESLNFLDVAESRLSNEPFWLAEVYALRGDNLRALGMKEKAEASYTRALSLNSGNRTASEALSRLPADPVAAPAH
ncbi:MAG TPA: tetratricopeptide repeat protein [Candidatus Binatia bacterium]|jgi:hypothetical protein